MVFEEDKIKEAISKALKDLDMESGVIDDATFHMTDWLSDLNNWHSFCNNPDTLSSDEIQDLLMAFLVHVPAHVAAASKLITGFPVEDTFEVGATAASKKQ